MKLFSDLEDFQQYLRVNGDLDLETIAPYIDAAIDRLLPWMGQEVIDLILAEDESLTELMPYIKSTIAPWSIELASENLDVGISNQGFVVTSTTTSAPASAQRVAALKSHMNNLGYRMLERCLEFMYANRSDYDEWTASDEYSNYANRIIRTCAEFNKYVDQRVEYAEFYNAHSALSGAEFTFVYGYISKTQTLAIIASINGTLSAAIKNILPLLRRAVANKTMYDRGLGDRFNNIANAYIAETLKVMDAAPDSYPEYKASTAYSATRTNYQQFENTSENKIFVFGG